MSWWIYLDDENGDVIDTNEVRHEGGTQVLGGCTEAELNVTYNYGCHFNFPELHGQSAKVAKALLIQKYDKLKDNEDNDYWKATEGNVKRAIKTLIGFAEYTIKNNIEAFFRVS